MGKNRADGRTLIRGTFGRKSPARVTSRVGRRYRPTRTPASQSARCSARTTCASPGEAPWAPDSHTPRSREPAKREASSHSGPSAYAPGAVFAKATGDDASPCVCPGPRLDAVSLRPDRPLPGCTKSRCRRSRLPSRAGDGLPSRRGAICGAWLRALDAVRLHLERARHRLRFDELLGSRARRRERRSAGPRGRDALRRAAPLGARARAPLRFRLGTGAGVGRIATREAWSGLSLHPRTRPFARSPVRPDAWRVRAVVVLSNAGLRVRETSLDRIREATPAIPPPRRCPPRQFE
jgi:hypothetical protein